MSSIFGVGKNLVKAVVKENIKSSASSVLSNSITNRKNNRILKKSNRNEISLIADYVKTNLNDFELQIFTLTEDTKDLISSYESANIWTKHKLSREIESNQKYLYLSKTFFSLLSKASSGVQLKDNQNKFIVKFLSFFDGVKVLSVPDEDQDDSIMGSIKKEIAEAIDGSNRPFSYDDFLVEFRERKEKFSIPDVDKYIILFDKMYPTNNKRIPPISINIPVQFAESKPVGYGDNKPVMYAEPTLVCPNCHTTLTEGLKFCPGCGVKLLPQKQFCSECGNKCEPGVKYCTYCGNKLF